MMAAGLLAWTLGAFPAEASNRTYTLDADFDEGVLVGAEHDSVHDQLQVSADADTLPVLWVANAGEDTISRWNVNTNREEARYRTWFDPIWYHSPWEGPAPSRTVVDQDGNCYALNRHFDGRPALLFKILLDGFIDRDGDGVADTSQDTNGDGVIDPSEMLFMTDADGDGVIDPNEIADERVAWAVPVGYPNGLGRAVALDGDGNVWVGLFNDQAVWKVDGGTGAILGGPYPVYNSPYGMAIDANGRMWMANLGQYLIEFDTTSSPPAWVANHDHGFLSSNYGIALGTDASGQTVVYLSSYGWVSFVRYSVATGTFDAPAAGQGFESFGVSVAGDGSIYAGVHGGCADPGCLLYQGALVKYAPDGTRIWEAPPQASGDNRGVPVDANGDVWFINLAYNSLSKFRGTDGAALGVFSTGYQPYTYSDATGLGLRRSFPVGQWTVIHDSGVAGAADPVITWNQEPQGLEPPGTSIVVEVRAADDQASLPLLPWVPVVNGAPVVGVAGRYHQVRATLTPDRNAGVSPVLSDLSIAIRTARLACEVSGPIGAECAGSVVVDALVEAVPGAEPLAYAWTTDCAGHFADPTTLPAVLVLDPTGACSQACTVTLAVTQGTQSTTCSAPVSVTDTLPPVVVAGSIGACYPSVAAAEAAAVAATSATDACGGVVAKRASTSGACAATITVVGADACGHAASVTYATRIDGTPPVVIPPSPATVECPAPASGPQSEASWIAAARATDDCAVREVLNREVSRTPGCGGTYVLVVEFWAIDECGNESARTPSTYSVVDTTPPVVQAGSEDLYCAWSPNHEYVPFPASMFDPVVTDSCAGEPTWRISGCSSNQPDDGLGDGHTDRDCIVDPGGRGLAVRSERLGNDPAGRRFGVEVVATDACGNESAPTIIGYIHVPHDNKEHEDCIKPQDGPRVR